MRDYKVFVGTYAGPFGDAVLKCLKHPSGRAKMQTFSNHEVCPEVIESIRRKIVFFIQSFGEDPNAAWMETWAFMDAAMRASTIERHCVLPFMAYQRQDSRGENRRVPVSLRLVAKFLQASGATGVMTSEPHSKTNEAAFDIPVDVVFPRSAFVKAFRADPELALALQEGRLVIVAPDSGAAQRADAYSRELGVPLCIVTKRRTGPNESEAIAISGDVKGMVCIIVDDMIDTAGTVVHAAQMLKDHGAEAVYAAMVHPVLSGPAIERINHSVIKSLLVSDSIPLSAAARACSRIAPPVSLAQMYADAIEAIVRGESVSAISSHSRS